MRRGKKLTAKQIEENWRGKTLYLEMILHKSTFRLDGRFLQLASECASPSVRIKRIGSKFR